MASSRVQHLEDTLAVLQYHMALKAFDLVIQEMSREKGYTRHNGTHYYYHLVDVAQKLLNFGIRDEDIITAALLHDIVEDVPTYTIERIIELFNPRVARIVDLVTKKEGIDYKKGENLQRYLDEIFEDYGAALIKTADRMHNFGTLLDATPEKRIRQAIETETYFIPFFKKCRKRYRRYAFIFFEAKTQIEPNLMLIKEYDQTVKELQRKIDDLKAQCKKTI